jgi:hypothetical protein
MKARRRKTTTVKRRKEPMAARGRGSSVAGLQEQLDLRTRELAETQAKLDQHSHMLSEALDQQKATTEVLRVISNSPGWKPVQAMPENAVRICAAKFGTLNLRGRQFRIAAMHGAAPACQKIRLGRGARLPIPRWSRCPDEADGSHCRCSHGTWLFETPPVS